MAVRLNFCVLDLGTTSIKAAVFTDQCQMVEIFSQPAPPVSVEKNYYVSDAMAYLQVVEQLLKQCQQYCQPLPKLGVCYQRSSFLIWNRSSGEAETALISWQDNRGQCCCDELQDQQAIIRQLSGLSLTPYYFAPKLHVLLKQNPILRQGLINKQRLVGTLDSFLIWHWTKGKRYITDASMAARTLLMDVETGQWSEQLCNLFNIPLQVLPNINNSCDLNIPLFNRGMLQVSVADQSAALLASVKNDDSEVLINLGTGGFVIRHTVDRAGSVNTKYLQTLVYQDSKKNNHMAREGTLNSITAALQPYPYRLCKLEHLAEIDDIYCIAEPSGIGSPFFRADIALLFSKSVTHLSKPQIAALLLEGIIFRLILILEDYNQQAKIDRVYLSGGLSCLPCLQQAIALLSPAPTCTLIQEHSSLLGTAILTHKLPLAMQRQSESILVHDYPKLVEKYQRWKIWFALLLDS